jgi:hypothetical protein
VSPASVKLFRGLILASVLTGFIGGLIDMIIPGLIPEPLAKAIDSLPDTPLPAIVGAGALVVITFGGTVAAIVGLYFFQPWSRTLAVSMTLLTLLFYPLLGVSVQSGWASLLLEISTTLWGAVIAISYVSSLSARFEAGPQPR